MPSVGPHASVGVLHDVLAVPGAYCPYDLAGHHPSKTLTWSGERARGPKLETIPVPDDPIRIERPVVFGGLLPKPHFGHVVLEAFSRFWVFDAVVVERGTPVAHFTHRGRTLAPFEQWHLDAALDSTGAGLLPTDRPMRFREVALPTQAIVLGQPFDPAILPIYNRVRQCIVGDPPTDDRPVHLSRARVTDPRRRALGGIALDRRSEDAGVRVLQPQQLPLEEHLRAVSAARTVTGLNGSALHLTMFRQQPGAPTVSIDPRAPFAIQADVERVRGGRFDSLHAQYPLNPRLPGGRRLEVGRYRNVLEPRSTARRLLATIGV